jgi:hypothetical protein
MDNALLLVVGYTDSTGGPDFNQELSEKRAGRVVNYLQQACGWKPYRMLTPTGMAEADPLADNSTVEGKAQNRRVAVNVLVSKFASGTLQEISVSGRERQSAPGPTSLPDAGEAPGSLPRIWRLRHSDGEEARACGSTGANS